MKKFAALVVLVVIARAALGEQPEPPSQGNTTSSEATVEKAVLEATDMDRGLSDELAKLDELKNEIRGLLTAELKASFRDT